MGVNYFVGNKTVGKRSKKPLPLRFSLRWWELCHLSYMSGNMAQMSLPSYLKLLDYEGELKQSKYIWFFCFAKYINDVFTLLYLGREIIPRFSILLAYIASKLSN